MIVINAFSLTLHNCFWSETQNGSVYKMQFIEDNTVVPHTGLSMLYKILKPCFVQHWLVQDCLINIQQICSTKPRYPDASISVLKVRISKHKSPDIEA